MTCGLHLSIKGRILHNTWHGLKVPTRRSMGLGKTCLQSSWNAQTRLCQLWWCTNGQRTWQELSPGWQIIQRSVGVQQQVRHLLQPQWSPYDRSTCQWIIHNQGKQFARDYSASKRWQQSYQPPVRLTPSIGTFKRQICDGFVKEWPEHGLCQVTAEDVNDFRCEACIRGEARDYKLYQPK